MSPEQMLAMLRHAYEQCVNGGVKDSAQAKRFAEGLIAPVIRGLETLVTFSKISDPANAHLFTKEAAAEALKAVPLPQSSKRRAELHQFQYITVCPRCHNKRCPKAWGNEYRCNNSNAPGQVGERE